MKSPYSYSLNWLVGFFILIIITHALSQTPYEIIRIQEKIQLDGMPDEPVWDTIDPLPMVQIMPVEGNPPSEKTEIFIAYDNEYLYLAGRLYDSQPDKIQITSKKRDFLGGNSAWFGLILDTFNDNENGMGFFTTPAGLRLDLTVFDDAQGDFPINTSWNTFWDAKTVVNSQGWFSEIRIPFTSLRFQEKDGQITMGLIVWRWIAYKSEQLIFPAIPNAWGGWSSWKPSQAHEIILKDIKSRKPLYVTPYGLGGFGRIDELNEAETAYERDESIEYEFGLDMKYSLTSNLTMDLTLNTDFAQVEADDQQINLTRFSLFFPEKRLFFQERSSNFDFSLGGIDRLFYSRRIGLYDDKPVRIYGGVRLVGRTGSWDMGLMSMQTEAIEELPSENFSVLRLRRQIINPSSYVGCIVTSRYGNQDSYNMAYGLDGIFHLFGKDYLRLHLAQTMEDSLANKPFSMNPTHWGFRWEKRTVEGFAYDLQFRHSGRDFNPDMGFEMRDDFTHLGTRLLYGWFPGEQSSLLRHDLYMNGNLYWDNTDSRIESADFNLGWEGMSRKAAWGQVSLAGYQEAVADSFSLDDDVDVPDGYYSFFGFNGIYQSPGGNRYFWIANLYAGTFYDGWRFTAGFNPTWSLSSDFEISGYLEYNDISFPERDQHLNALISRIRVLWMLNTRFSVTAFVQYNTIADAVLSNIRIRYNPREGNDLYLVYDEGYNTNRHSQSPVPPQTANPTILLKYSCTFIL